MHNAVNDYYFFSFLTWNGLGPEYRYLIIYRVPQWYFHNSKSFSLEKSSSSGNLFRWLYFGINLIIPTSIWNLYLLYDAFTIHHSFSLENYKEKSSLSKLISVLLDLFNYVPFHQISFFLPATLSYL